MAQCQIGAGLAFSFKWVYNEYITIDRVETGERPFLLYLGNNISQYGQKQKNKTRRQTKEKNPKKSGEKKKTQKRCFKKEKFEKKKKYFGQKKQEN